MIEELTHLPPNVVGFKASGEVKKEDYDKVIFPRIHDQMKHDEKLNYIFVIETPLKNFTGGAWIQDAWLGLKELLHWRKVAIVSDSEGVRSFTNAAGHCVPGEYKGFPIADLETAVEWVAN